MTASRCVRAPAARPFSARSAVGLLVLSAVSALAGASLVACEKAAAKPAANGGPQAVIRSTEIKHEACDESHKGDVLDSNRDGKPDIFTFLNGAGQPLCSRSDLDYDGKTDLFTYFDSSGLVRRREADYDGNGIANAVETYKTGKLVLREVDASSLGKFDTWDMFDDNEKLVRRERDLNGDGKVDQFWEYSGDKVTILVDRDGDGRPDPDSALLWGPNGVVPLASASAGGATLPALTSAPAMSTAAPSTAPPSVTFVTAMTPPPATASDAGAPGQDAGTKRVKR